MSTLDGYAVAPPILGGDSHFVFLNEKRNDCMCNERNIDVNLSFLKSAQLVELHLITNTLGVHIVAEGKKFALHVSPPWRVYSSEIILASFDYNISESSLNYDEKGYFETTAAFKKINSLKENLPLKIKDVSAGKWGEITLIFDNGWVFENFSDTSDKETELWRIFEIDKKEPHTVAYINRFEKE